MSRLPIVSAAALRAAVSVRDLIGPVAHAFVEYSAGRGAAPITVLHPTSHSDLHIKAAVLDGHDLVTVKAAGWSARLAETDGAASSGFIAVFSAATCRPIALLVDDHYLTDIRTAAAGAVAARVLARDEVDVVGVIGTGEQVLADRIDHFSLGFCAFCGFRGKGSRHAARRDARSRHSSFHRGMRQRKETLCSSSVPLLLL